jgi:hypothetical protein
MGCRKLATEITGFEFLMRLCALPLAAESEVGGGNDRGTGKLKIIQLYK